MERNVESHFSELPQIDIARSRFDMSHGHKTTFNIGELIPLDCIEILPGDTFEVKTSAVVRLQTLLAPIFDSIYLDTYWFFIPNRLVWDHWREFMGENRTSAWLPTTTYTVPRTLPPNSTGWTKGTIADYMGIPVGIDSSVATPQSLPLRSYALVCREWFTDQNLTDPVVVSTGDSATQGSNGSSYITDTEKGGMPFKVAKYHDYFTSCLPYPQKSADISLFGTPVQTDPLNPNSMYDHFAPVYATSTNHDMGLVPMQMRKPPTGTSHFYLGSDTGSNPYTLTAKNTQQSLILNPSNLYANLSYTDLTISNLRMAFQMQKFFERSALYGTRYREVLKSQFGVTSSDARMMVPEYLGGHRFPLSVHQVANTAQTNTDFLGDLGAMSCTSDVHEEFIKSFEEHGHLLCVACARYSHSYPQGLHRMWSRRNMLDYYFPVFQNLSNQPVAKNEIDWVAGQLPTQVFGYQEAWAEYRYVPSRTSGEFRPGQAYSLSSWHLADYYTAVPSLSDAWIREDKSNVDRVLAVTSSVSNQVLGDFWFDMKATRAMPVYSVPGLIDHH